jgi:hypothetical protein
MSYAVLVAVIAFAIVFHKRIVHYYFPLWDLPWTSPIVPFTATVSRDPESLSRQITNALSRKGPVVRVGANEVVIVDIGIVRRVYATFPKWPAWYESTPSRLYYG